MNDTAKPLLALQTRLLVGGDLNEACQALDKLRNETRLQGGGIALTVLRFSELVSNIQIADTSYQATASETHAAMGNTMPSRVAQWPEHVLEAFKNTYPDDARFTALIAAIEDILPEYKKLAGTQQGAER